MKTLILNIKSHHCGSTRDILNLVNKVAQTEVGCLTIDLSEDADTVSKEDLVNIKTAECIVILSPCVGAIESFNRTIRTIKKILQWAQEAKKILIFGCISNGLLENHKSLLDQRLECYGIMDYGILAKRINEITGQADRMPEDFIPNLNGPTNGNNMWSIRLCDGCTNDCLFCKHQYLNGPVKSLPFDMLRAILEYLAMKNIASVQLFGTNLFLYSDSGKNFVDVLKLMKSYSNIKKVFLSGVAFRNLTDEIIQAINEYEAIYGMDHSLESGSDQTLALMNKGVSVEECLRKWEKLSKNGHVIYRRLIIMLNYCSPKDGSFDPSDTEKTASVLNAMPVDCTDVTPLDYIPQSHYKLPNWLCRYNVIHLINALREDLDVIQDFMALHDPVLERTVKRNRNTLVTECGDLRLTYNFEKGRQRDIIAEVINGGKLTLNNNGYRFIVPPRNKFMQSCMLALEKALRKIYFKPIKGGVFKDAAQLKKYIDSINKAM